MALARRLVELGRSARASACVKIRQPLARALVGAPGFAALPGELRDQIADELNVRALEPLAAVGGDLVDYTVQGRTSGRWASVSASGTQAVAAAIAPPTRRAGSAALPGAAERPTVGVDGAAVTPGAGGRDHHPDAAVGLGRCHARAARPSRWT